MNQSRLAHRTLQQGSHTWSSRGPGGLHRLAGPEVQHDTPKLWSDTDGLFVHGLSRIESRFFVLGPGTQIIHLNTASRFGERHLPVRIEGYSITALCRMGKLGFRCRLSEYQHS